MTDPYNIIDHAELVIRGVDYRGRGDENSPSHRATAHLTDDEMDEMNSNYDPGYRASNGAIGGGGKPNGKRVW